MRQSQSVLSLLSPLLLLLQIVPLLKSERLSLGGGSPFQNWPSPELPGESGQFSLKAHTSDPRAFVQEENSPAPNDGQSVRPFHRYIFQGVRFAKPPDPQTVWHEQLSQLRQKDKQNLEFMGKPEIPQAIRNYFSLDMPPDKMVKEFTGVDLHSIFGSNFDKFIDTTTSTTFTRPTTPKDKLVQYFERSLDNFLDGRYRAMERIPYLYEKEKLLKTKNSEEALNKKVYDEEPATEGSGEDPNEFEENSFSSFSSINGIPKQIPFIPKVPVDFVKPQENQPSEMVSKMLEINAKKVDKELDEVAKTLKGTLRRPQAKGAVLMEASSAGDPQLAKPIKQDFQYGAKPSYQQGMVSSLLQFLGINNPPASTELDKVLTEWIMDHSPRHVTKHEKKSYGGESSYVRMQKFLSSPLTPLCTTQTEAMNGFELDSLMGQWFEVMHSSLMSSSMCSMFFYEMLSRSSSPEGVGSVFQTLQYSSPKRHTSTNPTNGFRWGESVGTVPFSTVQQPVLSSGYAIALRPGQIVFRPSKSPEEVNVRIIAAAYGEAVPWGRQYEYAILGINCNYPLFVIARDPYTFKQKYESVVMETLERNGLTDHFSHLLDIVTGIDPAQCQLPTHFFDAKGHF
uniref:Uncharacterized protein n=1 Tax=Globodera rostochiensis TaxID=31243 RepID=A0A914I8I4_GLORO